MQVSGETPGHQTQSGEDLSGEDLGGEDFGGEVLVGSADRSHLSELAALRASWTVEKLGPREDPEFESALAEWLEAETPRRRFWIARAGDEPVGMVNLLTINRMPAPGWDRPSWGYLNNMFVRSEFRNRGVGAALVEAVLAHAREHDLHAILLNPSDMAVSLYARFGFAPAVGMMAWTPA